MSGVSEGGGGEGSSEAAVTVIWGDARTASGHMAAGVCLGLWECVLVKWCKGRMWRWQNERQWMYYFAGWSGMAVGRVADSSMG